MLLNLLFKHWSDRLFAPEAMLRQTYDAFKILLESDGLGHDLMAEFEILFYEGKRRDFSAIVAYFSKFSAAVEAMVSSLERMNPSDAATLRQYYKKFDFYVRFLLAPPEQTAEPPYVVALDTIAGSELVGNKAHNLAVLKNELSAPVPAGFSITTNAYYQLIEYNQLREPINAILARIDIEDASSLASAAKELKQMIRSADFPPQLEEEILCAYDTLEQEEGQPVATAVRSSAVSEDGEYSFAGQYRTVLGAGRDTVLADYLEVVLSKYTPEALFYRITVGLSDEETPIAVLVLSMVDAGSSGVVYTVDPMEEQSHGDLVIHSIFGLGELLVSGATNADSLYICRERGILTNKIKGIQNVRLVSRDGELLEKDLSDGERAMFSLEDQQALELAQWGRKIEDRYGQPQDIEWALTTEGELTLLQARPLQLQEIESVSRLDPLPIEAEVVLHQVAKAAGGVAGGHVFLLSGRDVRDIEEGTILVTENTPPSLVRVMDKLVAVVADKGSSAGHFATVCREFGVPLLINSRDATSRLSHGQEVTVDADSGTVYEGLVEPLLANNTQKKKEDLPYFRKLKGILGFITPLNLVDASADNFQPSSCRSFHDIIRYTHEQAIQAMFSMGDKVSGRSGNCRQLETELPLEVYLLDLGGGMREDIAVENSVQLSELQSGPFLALWQGLTHEGVDWKKHSHFDWKSFDDIALAGGIATQNSGDFASYAIISNDYLNLNMRFGYHFTLVDALCGGDRRANYCQLRFAGGGGEYNGKVLRLEFLSEVLQKMGFEVTVRADLLDARMADIACEDLLDVLDTLGRLLGASKLMDMVLKDDSSVAYCVEQFFNGNYNFSR